MSLGGGVAAVDVDPQLARGTRRRRGEAVRLARADRSRRGARADLVGPAERRVARRRRVGDRERDRHDLRRARGRAGVDRHVRAVGTGGETGDVDRGGDVLALGAAGRGSPTTTTRRRTGEVQRPAARVGRCTVLDAGLPARPRPENASDVGDTASVGGAVRAGRARTGNRTPGRPGTCPPWPTWRQRGQSVARRSSARRPDWPPAWSRQRKRPGTDSRVQDARPNSSSRRSR